MSPFHHQIDTLPDLVRRLVPLLDQAVQAAFPISLCEKLQSVIITGCGDSCHAAIGAELAFHQLAGLPCRAMPAMQFGRYTAAFLPATNPGRNLLLAVSVSGRVSRTIEALNLGRQAGSTAVALTGHPHSPLGQAADFILHTAVPPLADEMKGFIVPGVRTYTASQIALYLCAIHIGAMRGHLTQSQAANLRQELESAAALMAETISQNKPVVAQIAQAWLDAGEFVFCGSGPNFGAALFSAAKVLEASGDTAVGQDMEEWAHLQYFARQVDTPTFLISGGVGDEDRTMEIATAAKAIGRRVALIAPGGSLLAQQGERDVLLPTAGSIRECFSPLLTSLPGELLAAYRAEAIGEPYFRAFGGGRSAQGGGGISRIQTSHQQLTINR